MTLGCDGCTLCCRLIGVPEINKPRDHLCSHATPGKGCDLWTGLGEFKGQPSSCALFYCGWLASQSLPPGYELLPELRPDRCGVVIGPIDEEDPKKLYVNVDPERPDAWRTPDMLEILKNYLQNGVTVVMYVGDRSVTFARGSPTVRATDHDESSA